MLLTYLDEAPCERFTAISDVDLLHRRPHDHAASLEEFGVMLDDKRINLIDDCRQPAAGDLDDGQVAPAILDLVPNPLELPFAIALFFVPFRRLGVGAYGVAHLLERGPGALHLRAQPERGARS